MMRRSKTVDVADSPPATPTTKRPISAKNRWSFITKRGWFSQSSGSTDQSNASDQQPTSSFDATRTAEHSPDIRGSILQQPLPIKATRFFNGGSASLAKQSGDRTSALQASNKSALAQRQLSADFLSNKEDPTEESSQQRKSGSVYSKFKGCATIGQLRRAAWGNLPRPLLS
uniref:Uncharacterized protein n=1 Tax=Plectus sambesii TaxID=2011161 RepID=A0A914V4E1_9BILA